MPKQASLLSFFKKRDGPVKKPKKSMTTTPGKLAASQGGKKESQDSSSSSKKRKRDGQTPSTPKRSRSEMTTPQSSGVSVSRKPVANATLDWNKDDHSGSITRKHASPPPKTTRTDQDTKKSPVKTAKDYDFEIDIEGEEALMSLDLEEIERQANNPDSKPVPTPEKKECQYGSSCNYMDDAKHNSKFSHTVKLTSHSSKKSHKGAPKLSQFKPLTLKKVSSQKKSISTTPPSSSKFPKRPKIAGVNGKVVASRRASPSTVVQIIHGDITKESVGAIVNAANNRLKHGSGVAGAIRKKGGWKVQQESDAYVAKHGQVKNGECAVTGPGKLPCDYIIHAVGPRYRAKEHIRCSRELRAAVVNSLKAADKLKLLSISIPAISSGVFGFPKNECATTILKSALNYPTRNATGIKQIRITIIDYPTVSVFQKALGALPTRKSSPKSKSSPSSSSKAPSESTLLKKSAAKDVVWQWKCELSFGDKDAKAWQDYSVAESKQIEKNYQKDRNLKFPVSHAYGLNLGDMVQFRIADETRRRPVRRILR